MSCALRLKEPQAVVFGADVGWASHAMYPSVSAPPQRLAQHRGLNHNHVITS